LRAVLRSDEDLYIWLLGLMLLYLCTAQGVDLIRRRRRRDRGKLVIDRCFNAATFANSIVLLIGILSPDMLKAIGSIKPYLLFAGFTGLWYALTALFM
jgi:hypothetical protein